MRLAVIGSGYGGLVTGVCMAMDGHQVTCVDSDAGKIALMQGGTCPIYEEGLEALMRQARASVR